MEKNCIFCEAPIHPDVISYKVGEHFICYRCASTQTIRNLSNAINDELRVGPNVIDVTDSSLSGQTDSGTNNIVEFDKSKLGNSSLAGQTDSSNESGEESSEYVHDAAVMSEDDYLSKYVDDYDALKYWTEAHPESIE